MTHRSTPATRPTEPSELVLRAWPVDRTVGGAVVAVTPESAGWGYGGLEVRELPAGASHRWRFDRDEVLLLPLRGACAVEVVPPSGEATRADLAGRASVFGGPTDVVYGPAGSTLTVTAAAGGLRVALATARATRPRPVRVLGARDAVVELRGAGRCSRQVTNYTLGTDVAVDHLLVCEVITPGGNWSSYPPHKHDEHADDERELEEIYHFEVADGPAGPGFAYHRVYGTQQRPIEVLAEVRSGDTVLVPHGYHGPSTAPPGYDLYYLNVMAGPADDGRWLSVDDPAHHWVRDTWPDQPVDPRLPFGMPSTAGPTIEEAR